MLKKRKKTIFLGLTLLTLLLISYFENIIFFQTLNLLFQNLLTTVLMVFIHNVTVASLILIAMTFYVNLVLQGFFKGQKYEYVILKHPKIFSIIFTIMIVFLSILRGSTIIFGEVNIEALPEILLISLPIGIIEGYGIYLTIKKTLSRTISVRNLIYIYGVFFFAASIEAIFICFLAYY